MESVLFSEVSLISEVEMHAIVVYTWGGKRCLLREVSSVQGVLSYRERVPLYI